MVALKGTSIGNYLGPYISQAELRDTLWDGIVFSKENDMRGTPSLEGFPC